MEISHAPIDIILFNIGQLIRMASWFIIPTILVLIFAYAFFGGSKEEPEIEELSDEEQGNISDAVDDEFQMALDACILNFPDEFKSLLDEIDIVTCCENEHGENVLGTYSGVPKIRQQTQLKSVYAPLNAMVNLGKVTKPQINLYKKAIISTADEKGSTLEEMINYVLVHEVAHGIGFSDEEIYSKAGRI